MPDAKAMGAFIRQRRLDRGLSLGQLAMKVGTSSAVVRSWERGDAVPPSDAVEKLAEALDVDATRLAAMVPAPSPATVETPDGGVAEAQEPEATTEREDDAAPDVDRVIAEGPAPLEVEPASEAEPEAPAPESVVAPESEIEPGSPVEAADAAAARPAVEEAAAPAGDATTADAVDAEAETVVIPALTDDHATGGAEQTASVSLEPAADPFVATPAPTEPETETPRTPGGAGPDHEDAMASSNIVDAPTEAIPTPVAAEPRPTPTAERRRRVPTVGTLRNPLDAEVRGIRWRYWLRAVLTAVVLIIMFFVLLWAVGQLFDALGQVLDNFRSTPTVDPTTGA